MNERIYVASSWRNPRQRDVVDALRSLGNEVYDFKNPREGDTGFSWREIDPDWENWVTSQYINNLRHPIATAGFSSDWNAMEWATMAVLVMPCGRSAHLEAGYFVGARKPLFILLEEAAEPELMYRMAETDRICESLGELVTKVRGLCADDFKPRPAGYIPE